MADDNTTPVTTNVQRDVTVKSHENISGHTDTFTSDRDVTMSGEFDDRVMDLLNGVLQERQHAEDKRANKRNENRLYTLLGALLIGIVVTYCLTTPGILPKGVAWMEPYAFTITIFLDSSLALYSYFRKY
jgi:hypothetical protein